MADKRYNYTSEEFLNYLRNDDPVFQGRYFQNLSDEELYNLGMSTYSDYTNQVEPLTPVKEPDVDVSPGWFDSLPRWTVNENSPDFMKSAYANSLQGMLDLYEDGRLPFEYEEYDLNVLEQLGSGIMGLLMPLDALTMFLGGGLVGAGIKQTAVKSLGSKAFQKHIADKAVKNKAIKLLQSQGLDQTRAADIFNRVISSGSQFGVYEGAKGGVGAALNGEDVKQGVFHGVVHGGTLGGVLGLTGGFLGNFYKELSAAKNIKAGTLFPKTPGLKGGAKAFETRAINQATKTNPYLKWSDDAIDKWMKRSGPGAQFSAEVGVLTGASQLDRYKQGEELTWGNLFNDAFFNTGFVFTMQRGIKAFESSHKAYKKWRDTLTPEEAFQKKIQDQLEKSSEEVSESIKPEADASTPEGKSNAENVKRTTIEQLKESNYKELRDTGIAIDHVLKQIPIYIELMKDTQKMGVKEIGRWKDKMKEVSEILNGAELALDKISEKGKPVYIKEEVSQMRTDIKEFRKSLDNLLHRKKDTATENLKAEAAEKTRLINFIKTKGREKEGKDYQPVIFEEGATREVPLKDLGKLNLEQLQSIESSLVQAATKKVIVSKDKEISYENIEIDVESKGLLNKNIEKDTGISKTEKEIVTDSNLTETSKNILAYAIDSLVNLGRLRTPKGGKELAPTKLAKEVLEFSQKEYGKDINKLTPNEQTTIIGNYLNKKYGVEVVNIKNGQLTDGPTLLKMLGGDVEKASVLSKDLNQKIKYLKEAFHQEGSIKNIIGFDLMTPKGKLLEVQQTAAIKRFVPSIIEGARKKINQWLKSSKFKYKAKDGTEFSNNEISMAWEMSVNGKFRPADFAETRINNIDLKTGRVVYKVPNKPARTLYIPESILGKVKKHIKENKLKGTDKLFKFKDTKQANEVLNAMILSSPKNIRPKILDQFTNKVYEWGTTEKTANFAFGDVVVSGKKISVDQPARIVRMVYEGETTQGVSVAELLGHTGGPKSKAQVEKNYQGGQRQKTKDKTDIEPTTPPTKGARRDAIETIEQAKDRHLDIAYKTKNKKTKKIQEEIAAEKDIILSALGEGTGAKFFKDKALEILSRHKQTHIDALKDKSLDAKSIEFHKNWIKNYTNVSKVISKGFKGSSKLRLFDAEKNKRITIDEARKVGYAARDYHIKKSGKWKSGMSKAEKSKIESKLIEESVIDAKKYNLKKISELNLEQVKELVDAINAMDSVNSQSKFGAREAKFFKHVSDNYKDLSRDDITLMLRDLGVKDGDVKNIKHIETFDILQGMIDGAYEKMPQSYNATSETLALTNPEIVMPQLTTGAKIWHGFASLLNRYEPTKPIAKRLFNSEVYNSHYKKIATETIESVMPKLKKAGFTKEEAYMFMFIDKKMYTGENAKFLSKREVEFINLMNAKEANPINSAKAEIVNMYKRYWEKAKEVIMDSDWASKMKKEDYINYLNQKFIENYYTRRVSPEVLKALLDKRGNVWKDLFNKNLDAEISKMKRKTNKKGKFIETESAFKLRKAEKRKDPSTRKKIEDDMERWFFSSGTRLDFGIMKNRKLDLPRKVLIDVKNKKGEITGQKEVNSYIEKFDATVGYYGVGMSKMITTLQFFPEFTKIGQKFGGGQLSSNLFKIMEGGVNQFGVNAEWAHYIKSGLENHLGLNQSRENIGFKKKLGILSSTSAAIGLSSPTSGLKNLAIGIPRSIGHFGFANTTKALYRFMTNNEDLIRRDLNWVKDYGSKQLVLEAQETIFERLPLVGHKLTMDNLFSINMMTKTEGVNRIVSSYAGNMVFEQMNSAYHGKGRAGVLSLGGKKEILRTYKDVWRLSEKEIKYLTETSYENLNTKNKKLMDFITLKVQHYSHVATQGSTSAALLPKWMSTDYARPLTLFQRMAWSTTTDIRTNYLEPIIKTGNAMPLLRATVAHGLSGYGLYKFYEFFMGYEVPEQLDDNALKRVLPYLWRSEFFGLFGELFNPHSSFLYDKNKGPLDLFGGDATQARGLLEPVIIRNAALLVENAPEIFKGLFPGELEGKQTKLVRQALKDFVTQSTVVFGQASRIYDNYRSSDLKSHRQLKQISREFMKDKGKTFPRVMMQNFRSPYYRDLKDSFWHKNEQEWARTYWNAYNYLVTEYQNDGYLSFTAHKKAKQAIKQSLSFMNPVKQFSEDSKGRLQSKKSEFLAFLKKKDPEKYKEAIRLEKEFEFRMRKINSIVNKYQKQYSVFPISPNDKPKYTGKYFGIY